MNLGAHDIMSYFSVENGDVGVFSQALGNAQFKMNKPINQGDSRTTLNNLLGVRYVFARENQPGMQAFPYGYHVAKKNGKAVTYADKPVHGFGNSYGTTILTSKYALPLAYLQTQKLSAKQFKHLSDTDREQALTTGALYEAAAPKVKTTTYHSRQRELSYKVRPLEGNGHQQLQAVGELPTTGEPTGPRPGQDLATVPAEAESGPVRQHQRRPDAVREVDQTKPKDFETRETKE